MWKWILLVAVSFDRLRPVSAGETLPPRRAPRISDEEENTLAEKFQCPACTAVFWELDHALKTAESSPLRSAAKVAENSPLTESEYIDVFEVRCLVVGAPVLLYCSPAFAQSNSACVASPCCSKLVTITKSHLCTHMLSE